MTPETINEFNANIITEFRANGGVVSGMFAGAPMILVTTTGAKSGVERTSPLVHGTDGDDVYIMASMGGAPKHPSWYHNVVANPAVTVELGAETFAATAVPAEGAERDRLYAKVASEMPQFAEYQSKTERTIPIVVLKRNA